MSAADDQFKQLLKSENDYDNLIGLFVSHFTEEDGNSVKLARRIFKTINSILTNKKFPARFYLSTRLVKDLMILDQNKFEELCAAEILPLYKEILYQLVHSSINEIVPQYFGESLNTSQIGKETQMGEKFFKTILESVQVWAKQVASNPAFKETYQQLKQLGVPFPTKYEMYDNQEMGDGQNNQQHQNFDEQKQAADQRRFEESKVQGSNNNGKQKNPMLQILEKYESSQTSLSISVNNCRGKNQELKNLLPAIDQSIKGLMQNLETDIQKCISDPNQDQSSEHVLEKLFEFQGFYTELEQDMTSLKQGIFDPQTFINKYGGNQMHQEQVTRQGDNNKFDHTPTPNDAIMQQQKPAQSQNKINQQPNLYDFNEDDEYEHEPQRDLQNQKLIEDQQREKQLKEQQQREQQFKEQQQKEQQLKEQQLKQQQIKEQQLREQQLREQQLREQQQREQQQREQQIREQQLKEQQQQQMEPSIQQIPQQKSVKLSELNKMKEQQSQKQQQYQEEQYENMNAYQNVEQPKHAKEYFQEEEFYDPNRAAEQQQQLSNRGGTNKNVNSYNSNIIDQQGLNQYEQKQSDQSRVGNQSDNQSFKSFTNESYRNKHYQSMMVKSNSQSKFTKTINENLEKYIQPYASSKIGFNQSISTIDRIEQTKSSYPDKKKPQFSQNEKLKEIKQENVNLQSKIVELQSNVKLLSSADQNTYLLELKQQNEENSRKLEKQSDFINSLQSQLNQIQDENQRLKSQGSQLSNNFENEQLKGQISKLQQDYQDLLHQRNTQRSEHMISNLDNNNNSNVESHPQYQALLRQNEELKSKISLNNGSNQPSLIHQNFPANMPSSTFQFQSPQGINSSRGRPENINTAGGVGISKRFQSPKIFQDFRPRGVDEQNLRQSVDSLNLQAMQQNNNRPQQIFSTQHMYGSTANNGIQQPSNPIQEQFNQYRMNNRNNNSATGFSSVQPGANQSGSFTVKHTQPIFAQQAPPPTNFMRRAFESPKQDSSYKPGDNILTQFNSEMNAQRSNIKKEFNTPPSQNQASRIPGSNGQNSNVSPKKIFDGMGDMKDVSQIPSIIFNEKREEIESIQKNNQSTHSYSESVKEILNPLSTKNNINDNQIVVKNVNNTRPLNFSEVKEGEQVEFDKNLFSLILQYVSKLNRFKASCLKTKYPIYEDSQIQIGVVSSHQQSNTGNYFRVQLYYSNKGSRALKNLKVTVLDDQKNYQVHISPEIIQEIEPKQQKKQEIMIAYSFMPFNPCFISINYSGVSPLYLGLPNTVNKMFAYKDINKDLFKRQFKERKYIKYILIPECNPKFAKTHQDFKMYLDKLVDLNPDSEFDHIQGTSKFKMGLQFSLDQYSNDRNPQDYFMKIVCNPDQSAHIFIGFNDYNQNEKVQFILNTFCFLFSSNKDN